MDRIKFRAKLEQHPGIDATYVIFPFNVERLFGTKGQVKVKAWIEKVFYRGSMANMGTGYHTLIVIQSVRKKINKIAGDFVDVELEQDNEERVVEIPSDLNKLFIENKGTRIFFDSLSFTNKKEYILWIESSKKEETRTKRLKGTIEKLKDKKKNPSAK